MTMQIDRALALDVLKLAVDAGREILAVYESDFSVQHKEDSSPLTEADRRSHAAIVRGLKALHPELPLLSEEGAMPEPAQRRSWGHYWLIDPLDGTKEFVKRNGEFTVNIALMERVDDAAPGAQQNPRWRPVLGVVYVPVSGAAYAGWVDAGETEAWYIENTAAVRGVEDFAVPNAFPLRPLTVPPEQGQPLRVVASRSHLSAETEEFIALLRDRFGEVDMDSYGSSLKLCEIARGAAHVYPRFAPTMEWDSAAAHGVCRAAGVSVLAVETRPGGGFRQKGELWYNNEILTNPWFLVTAMNEIRELL